MEKLKFIVTSYLDDEDDEDSEIMKLEHVRDGIPFIVLEGDWYQYKINDRIEGFIEAVEYLGYEYDIVYDLWSDNID